MVTPSVRLVRPLGMGGMGSVWLADHDALKTRVVVKFIAEELAGDAGALARFAREAAAAAQVKSPHVVQMLDHGVCDGLPYIVMEHLEGHDLGAHIESHGAMSPDAVCEVIAQTARALSRAHDAGVIHRDIKPSNIFLCDAGGGELFVKLLDFGVAKVDSNNLLDNKTRTGSLVGSPFYMSPEQVVGKPIDKRTDLWSLGVVAFEALTGIKPFEADTIGGLALKIHHEPLPVPTVIKRSLSSSIDAWFAKACAREPAERFQTARELADALAMAVRGELPPNVPLPSRAPPADDLALAKTTADPGVSPQTQSALSVPVAPSRPSLGMLAGAAAAAGVLGVIVVSRLVSPAASSGTAASSAPLVVSAPPSVIPPVALPSAPETPLVASSVPRKTEPTHPAVVHSVARPPASASAVKPAPSASALPVPTYDPNDIK